MSTIHPQIAPQGLVKPLRCGLGRSWGWSGVDMWPFDKREVRSSEQYATRAEFDEAVRRLKLLERDCDDLHAAYRRLRGSRAAEMKQDAPRDAERDREPTEAATPSSRKEELRKLYLTRGPQSVVPERNRS